jgi:hypothetical protein
MSREGRSQPIQPVVQHGFLGNTPANGTLPGRVIVSENDDRRRRTPPLQPIVLNGLYATVSAPVATPPAIVVTPLVEQKRTVFPAQVFHGTDDAPPQLPEVVEQPQRRTFVLQPIVVSGVLGFTVVTVVLPPKPVISFTSEKRQMVVPPVLPTPWTRVTTPPVTATVRNLPLLGVG